MNKEKIEWLDEREPIRGKQIENLKGALDASKAEKSIKYLELSLRKIIAQRKQLLRNKKSYKNELRCWKFIKEISLQLDFNEGKWTDNGLRSFVLKNIEKIAYLLPGNESGDTQLKKIIRML